MGLGAALAVNHIQNNYSAGIVNSTVTAGGDVELISECRSGIETVSGAIAFAADQIPSHLQQPDPFH